MSDAISDLKLKIRHKTIELWRNPDNPPEDKLIDLLEFTAEEIISHLENRRLPSR